VTDIFLSLLFFLLLIGIGFRVVLNEEGKWGRIDDGTRMEWGQPKMNLVLL